MRTANDFDALYRSLGPWSVAITLPAVFFVGRLFLCEMGHQLRATQRQRPQDRKYDFNLGLSLDAVQPVVNRSWAKSALWFRLHYGIRPISWLPRRFLCFWCRQLSPRTLA